MALFALMNKSSAVKVYRIDTDVKTDIEITDSFRKQLSDFEKDYPVVLTFDAGYSPSSNECQKIVNFIEGADLIDAVKRSTAMPPWTKQVGLDNISALFMAPDYPSTPIKIAIQSFSKRQILSASKYLWLQSNVFSMSDALGFNLDDKLVAILEGTEIKFRNFTNLRSMFDMNQYFALATNNDLTAFTNQTAFDIPQGFSFVTIADNVIRKKVALINKSGILQSVPVHKIVGAASNLSFTLNTSGSGASLKIVMPVAKKQVKELLDFLDEDYFKSELTQTRFRSNSKRKA